MTYPITPIDPHLETIIDLAHAARSKGMNQDIIALQQQLYAHHKKKHGSYKTIQDSTAYQTLMNARYTCIEQCINEMIENYE